MGSVFLWVVDGCFVVILLLCGLCCRFWVLLDEFGVGFEWILLFGVC